MKGLRRLALMAVGVAVLGFAGLTHAEVVQRGSLRVTFDGKLTPHALPRSGSVPVRVAVATKIDPRGTGSPPSLRRISIAINRYGSFNPNSLPTCTLRDIQPATTENALRACGDSLVGEGRFSARVLLAQQSPFPASGKLHAFNGIVHGKPALLAHVFGTDPVPTSLTLVFTLKSTGGTYGTLLQASLPEATGGSAYVTGMSLNLGRTVRSHGKVRSYLSGSCPAPAGLNSAVFPFARASFDFGRRTIHSTLERTCSVRR